MPEEKIRSELILALQDGDRKKARKILRQLIKEDDSRPEYWLWLSTVVHSRQESIYCLKKVLALEPGHPAAVRGLTVLGERSPGDVSSRPIPKVDWLRDVEDINPPEERSPFRENLLKGKRVPLAVGLAVLLAGLVLSGVLFPGRGSLFAPKLTITPITWTPSAEAAEEQPAGTPDLRTLTPIGKVLESTPTPTAVYVRTPRTNYSTYNTALQAYQKGDFQTMLTYLKTTVDMIETPDIVYLIGEAYRNLGQYQQALEAYERAVFLDPDFAPPYYGRALVKKKLDPEAGIIADLNRAAELDPQYGEVYLERAAYYAEREQWNQVLANADQAVKHLDASPRAHYYRALGFLETAQFEKAYRDGELALGGDINHVPTYQLMGRIYLALDRPSSALTMLGKYEKYADERDVDLYYNLGRAAYQAGEFQLANQHLTMTLEMGGEKADVYLMRGLSNLELDQPQQGFDDLYRAWKLEPDNFSILLTMGKAYFGVERYYPAISAFKLAESRAPEEAWLAEVLYWRARAYQRTDQAEAAQRDWLALVNLPEEVVPEAWLETAREELLPTATPTVTLTPTRTPSPTPSNTPGPTPSNTPGPGPTSTPTPAE
jgi:tetratricopeptide (TPR) repeat protein